VEGVGLAPRDLVVRRARPHRSGAVVELEEVADRDSAAALTGASIAALRSALPAVRPDEYYASDIVGLDAFAPDGARLGVVAEVVSTSANDVWVIRDERRELLVPAVAHAVLSVDIAARRVVVDPIASAARDEP
jgi:16S rRNA processing protein RimM